jgi:hypothetical protein
MPIEIQRMDYLYVPYPSIGRDPDQVNSLPPLQFNFQHDLESWWWVLLWSIIQGIEDEVSHKYAAVIFSNVRAPNPERFKAFKIPGYLHQQLEKYLPPSVRPLLGLICGALGMLVNAYLEREKTNRLHHVASYSIIHMDMHTFLAECQDFVSHTGFNLLSRHLDDTDDGIPEPPRKRQRLETNDHYNRCLL